MQKTVGIVGGGQLGRMMVEPAHRLGFKVTVLDPTPDSPAGQVADKQILGNFKDAGKIKELANEVDFLTFEIELADAETLEVLAKSGIPVNPTGETLKTIKNKHGQKVFFEKKGIPVAPFVSVDDLESGKKAGEQFGYPFVLKACLDSYDGRGNATAESEEDLLPKLASFAGRTRYAEQFIHFEKELAVMAARDAQGNVVTYPTTETVHKDHICHTTTTPATISEEVDVKAQKLARDVVSAFSGAGVFGIEMFLTKEGDVMVNEVAPRVHNSGHYTIEACVTSQFEQHVRCVTGMELGDTSLKVGGAAMVNILGDRNAPAEPQGIEGAEVTEGVSVHIYGKHETKEQRKMGHVTAVADTTKEALARAQKARDLVRI